MLFPNVSNLSAVLLLVAAALLPAIYLLSYVYKKDTVEPESPGLIVALLLGGVIAAPVAGILETIGQTILDASGLHNGSLAYVAILAFLVVGVSEELAKFYFMRRRTWDSPEFNFTFDGIIYGVVTALGFAAIENVLYVFQGGFQTAIARALLSVPGHASWGVFMGSYYGQAKVRAAAGDKAGSTRCTVLSVLVPMLLHGFYDTLAFIGTEAYTIALFVFCIIVDVSVVQLIDRARKSDMPIMGTATPAAPGVPGAYDPNAVVNPADMRYAAQPVQQYPQQVGQQYPQQQVVQPQPQPYAQQAPQQQAQPYAQQAPQQQVAQPYAQQVPQPLTQQEPSPMQQLASQYQQQAASTPQQVAPTAQQVAPTPQQAAPSPQAQSPMQQLAQQYAQKSEHPAVKPTDYATPSSQMSSARPETSYAPSSEQTDADPSTDNTPSSWQTSAEGTGHLPSSAQSSPVPGVGYAPSSEQSGAVPYVEHSPSSEHSDPDRQLPRSLEPQPSSQSFSAQETPAAQVASQQAAGMKKCPACGTMNPESHHHCYRCGTMLLS